MRGSPRSARAWGCRSLLLAALLVLTANTLLLTLILPLFGLRLRHASEVVPLRGSFEPRDELAADALVRRVDLAVARADAAAVAANAAAAAAFAAVTGGPASGGAAAASGANPRVLTDSAAATAGTTAGSSTSTSAASPEDAELEADLAADAELRAFASHVGWAPPARFSVAAHANVSWAPRQVVRAHWRLVTLLLTDNYFTYTCETLREAVLAGLDPRMVGFLRPGREKFGWQTTANTKPLFWLIPHVRALLELYGPRLVILFVDAHDSTLLVSRAVILARFIAEQAARPALRVLVSGERSCYPNPAAECAAFPLQLTARCVESPYKFVNSGGWIGGAVDVHRFLLSMHGRELASYNDQEVFAQAVLAQHVDVAPLRPLLARDGGSVGAAAQHARLGVLLDYDARIFMPMQGAWDPNDIAARPLGDGQWVDALPGEAEHELVRGDPRATLPEARIPLPLRGARIAQDCSTAVRGGNTTARLLPADQTDRSTEHMRWCNGMSGACPAIVHFNGGTKGLQPAFSSAAPAARAWAHMDAAARLALADVVVSGNTGPYFADGRDAGPPSEDATLNVRDVCCGPWASGVKASKARPAWLNCSSAPLSPAAVALAARTAI